MAFILIIQNDGTGNDLIANYNYEASLNNKILKQGKIINFDRRRPWWCLVTQVVLQQAKRFLNSIELNELHKL